MLKNYLKVAWRNLARNRTFSIINIAGLATGLCCFLLIVLYVVDELSFDRYNKNAARIYRIQTDNRFGATENHLPTSSDVIGPALKKEYPQVEEYVRFYTFGGNKLIKKGNEFINEANVAYADSTLFNVFTLPAIAGDPATALDDPNTVVITESTARRYFGKADVIGQTIETNDRSGNAYKVTAVIKDFPRNSHFHFDFIFSMDNAGYRWGNALSNNFFTYLLLKEGVDYKAFEKNFPQYISKYVMPQATQWLGVTSLNEPGKNSNALVYSLMPLTKIHLYSNRFFELSPNGNIEYVYIFSGVALFILLIACINFMNLTTARSAKRAREVGIRKVLGTGRKELISQFLAECTLLALFSLLIAVGIAGLTLPFFNAVAGKSMTIQSLLSVKILPLIICLPFIIGLLAGSYPAFYLSAFKPVKVLKGKLNVEVKGIRLRSALVVFQFAVSVVLIVATIVIYRQLNYIQTKNLGFNRDEVLIINDVYALNEKAHTFKTEVQKIPGVISGSLSGYLPVAGAGRNDNSFSGESVFDSKNTFIMQNWTIDYDYLKTMGIALSKGRNFSLDYGSDSSAVIINETAEKILGDDDPLQKKLYININGGTTALTIIGVVKNFHFESLRQNIGPLCFVPGNSTWRASFKITAAAAPRILQDIQTKWKTMAGGIPFSYTFLDESFNRMYNAEQRTGKIALAFSILTILIACLGLFGLATFMAQQRTKEIGIRKVLGASVNGMVALLSRDFFKLVAISFMIATPVAAWIMHLWLQDFAYRVNIAWWMFALAAGLVIVITLLTISSQAIRAAIANPVRSLRAE